MTFISNNYVAFSFAGYIVEGLDNKIYCFDPDDDSIFRLNNYRLAFVKRIFHDRLFDVIIDRGYVARRKRANRYAIRISNVPPIFSRVLYVPRSTFIGYNAERKIAVLRNNINSDLICVDYNVRPVEHTPLGINRVCREDVNIDRLLVSVHNYNSNNIRVYSLLKKDYVLETKTSNKAHFVYPVSEDTLAVAYAESFDILKQGKVIFSGNRTLLGINSIGDRILVHFWPSRCTIDSPYVYINTKTGRYCIIFDCADAVLLSSGVALVGGFGRGWFIVPNEHLEERPENMIFVDQMCRSDVFMSNSPTI